MAASTGAAAQPAPNAQPALGSIAVSSCQFANGRKVVLSDRTPDTYLFVMQTGAADLLAQIFINDDQTISVAVQGQTHEDPAQSRAIEVLFEELRIMPRQQITRTAFANYMSNTTAPTCERADFRDYYSNQDPGTASSASP
ncbi:MAG TPA: hypothetical protein VG943_10985 [Caulobacterales bacterium]|nr:hypothetical protein [Caulobacterales bacterium]